MKILWTSSRRPPHPPRVPEEASLRQNLKSLKSLVKPKIMSNVSVFIDLLKKRCKMFSLLLFEMKIIDEL